MHSLNTIIEQNKSKARKLIDLTLKNGGVSFNHGLNPLKINKGFTVSIENNLTTDNLLEVEKALNRLSQKRVCHVGCFFGLWIRDKLIYLDSNINLPNKELALEIANDRKEIAIYDNEKKESVIL